MDTAQQGFGASVRDFFKEYPQAATIPMSALSSMLAISAARKARERGIRVNPAVAGVAGGLLPLGLEYITNSGTMKNVNRWGSRGFLRPTSTMANTPNRDGYVHRYINSLYGGVNKPVEGNPYYRELPQNDMSQYNALGKPERAQLDSAFNFAKFLYKDLPQAPVGE